MGEITSQWVSVGNKFYQRTEIYSEEWSKKLSGFDRFTPAPYGGPVLVYFNNEIHVHQASGQRISRWRWRTDSSRIIACDWSHCEEALFVLDDGTILVYSLFGDLLQTTSMGQEAKDLKIKDAKIFRSLAGTTGVAVLTTKNRFFIVNNISDPRVRKLTDVIDWPSTSIPPWDVLTSDRYAKILLASSDSELTVITQSDIYKPAVDTMPYEKTKLRYIAVASDNSHVALCYEDGLLWMGIPEENKLCHVKLDPEFVRSMKKMIWCGLDSVVCFSSLELSQCLIVSTSGGLEDIFMPGFISAVQEIDGARIFSIYSLEMLQTVPDSLVKVYAIGSISPGAQLRMAAEKFFLERSHEADEYMRNIRDRNVLPEAVEDCIEAAGALQSSEHQKDLMRAAQFGKSFLIPGGLGIGHGSADAFSTMCKTLRVLNAMRQYRVGLPLTITQYRRLTPRVVIDRLLSRRLYPLSMMICNFLALPAPQGANRVLAHWACYKVSCNDDDASIAKSIHLRLGQHKPQIPYCDIASKAAECGKKELAIRLLEHEISVAKQVPLLVKLDEESTALARSLASGDRDLAFSVILQLRKKLSSTDFHMMIRKYPLGKVLYENYCQHHDVEALLDLYVQEDDFASQACQQFELAYQARRFETKQAKLIVVQDLFAKSKSEAQGSLVEDNIKLLKAQNNLEEKLGKEFMGLTLHQTIELLVENDDIKSAEKLKSDFKLSDRRYTWLKAKTLAKQAKWNDLKKLAKQKKIPIGVSNIVKLARKHGGEEAAKIFLTDEYLNSEEKFNLLTEFGMYLEAASTAFSVKNLEALNSLESICVGRDDILKMISSYKAKLVSK